MRDLLYNPSMPTPTLRTDGRWMLQLPRSKGQPRRCVYGRTREEVERKYQEAIGAGTHHVKSGSIAEFVVVRFAPWIALRPQASTLDRYDSLWRVHLWPHIGNLSFADLTPENVQETLLSGKSASTRQNAKSLLGQIVKLAIAHGDATEKTLMMVKLARVGSRTKKDRRDVGRRAQELLSNASGHWTEGPIWAAMTLGLRKAEVCGLMPTDVDTKAGTVTIRRQRGEGGIKDRLKSKSEGVNRRFACPPEMIERLLSYHREGTMFLFTRPDGSPLPYEHLDRYMEEFQPDERLTFHDLRAAAVSILVDLGVDDYTIMDITGHTDRRMIETYRDNRDERVLNALTTVQDNQA